MAEDSISLDLSHGPLKGIVNPGGSKSISNRLLIIEKLCGHKIQLNNLSKANDTVLLQQLLNSDDIELNCEDAGTTFRFLTAFLAISGEYRILSGCKRMQERPIGKLVDALNQLGANISYQNKPGFPPLIFNKSKSDWKSEVSISANTSSQFITSLMLIAPYLKKGLSINLKDEIVSMSYINMTSELMKKAGISIYNDDNQIKIKPGQYILSSFDIESDWSSASYFYGLASLKPGSEIHIKGLQKNSTQGDSIISDWLADLGVSTEYCSDGVIIRSKESKQPAELNLDFTNCPDLFQTISVILAAKGITGNFTGLSTLKIKETDRLEAMQIELKKTGVILNSNSDNSYLQQGKAKINNQIFDTYKDHRMAMALSIFSAIGPVTINNPGVVKKSFPGYWEALELVRSEM